MGLEFPPTKRAQLRNEKMNLESAINELERCYSEDDPVVYKGEGIAAKFLLDKLNQHMLASEIYISYYKDNGKFVKNGTLSAMVKDRQKMAKNMPSMEHPKVIFDYITKACEELSNHFVDFDFSQFDISSDKSSVDGSGKHPIKLTINQDIFLIKRESMKSGSKFWSLNHTLHTMAKENFLSNLILKLRDFYIKVRKKASNEKLAELNKEMGDF